MEVEEQEQADKQDAPRFPLVGTVTCYRIERSNRLWEKEIRRNPKIKSKRSPS
jgi:hypothetical protein